jgi:hypothetical protein
MSFHNHDDMAEYNKGVEYRKQQKEQEKSSKKNAEYESEVISKFLGIELKCNFFKTNTMNKKLSSELMAVIYNHLEKEGYVE